MNRTCIAILLLLAAGTGASLAVPALRPAPELPIEKGGAIIPSRIEFYDAQLTEAALRASERETPRAGIRAVVVPHHLLAAELIAAPLRAASGRPVSQVVIVGPNHEDVGGARVITSDAAWATPYGPVEPDPETAASLVRATGASLNPNAFLAEHSIGAIVPLVARLFPEARVVPVMLSSESESREAQALSAWLAALPEDALVVFSVDFSHGLSAPEASRRDVETLSAIGRRDAAAVLEWRSEHLDGPAVLATALLYARALGREPEVTGHADSNAFLEIPSGSVTTYFTMLIGD